MTARHWWVCSLAALLLGFGTAVGQDAEPKKPKRPARAKPQRKRPPRKARIRLPGEFARIAKALDLSEDQQKLIADAVAAQEEAMKKAEADIAAKMKEVSEQYKVLREKMDELSKQRQQLRYGYYEKVTEVLTNEQKVAWAKYQLKEAAMRSLPGVKLDAAQTDKLNELLTAAAEKLAGVKEAEKREAMAKAVAELKTAVEGLVTAEQKKDGRTDVLADQAMRMLRRAELTDEQKAKIRVLASEAVEQMAKEAQRAKALSEELRTLRTKTRTSGSRELLGKVKDSVLTPEQKAKLAPRPKPKPKPRKPAPPKKAG